MKVRLTKKLADRIDGVNLRDHRIGDVLDLPYGDAHLLLVEEWAMPERRLHDERGCRLRRRRDDQEVRR